MENKEEKEKEVIFPFHYPKINGVKEHITRMLKREQEVPPKIIEELKEELKKQ